MHRLIHQGNENLKFHLSRAVLKASKILNRGPEVEDEQVLLQQGVWGNKVSVLLNVVFTIRRSDSGKRIP